MIVESIRAELIDVITCQESQNCIISSNFIFLLEANDFLGGNQIRIRKIDTKHSALIKATRKR